MFDTNKKVTQEPGTAYVLAMLLMNVLILAIVAAVGWAFYAAMKNDNGGLNAILRGGGWWQ